MSHNGAHYTPPPQPDDLDDAVRILWERHHHTAATVEGQAATLGEVRDLVVSARGAIWVLALLWTVATTGFGIWLALHK